MSNKFQEIVAEELKAIRTEREWTESQLIALGFPPALAKAVVDPFDYAMRIRTGETFRFQHAEYTPGSAYVTIRFDQFEGDPALVDNADPEENDMRTLRQFAFPRGLDVRLSDIVWCADAPDGS